ncbi:MAG: anion transporter, partial [Methylococcaceae bacterium]|nr:anion transporter [Methylococcaceae bacterium]
MTISLAVLVVVFLLIAIRKIGHLQIKIWQVMMAGALVLLATGEIGWSDALKAIDVNVMLFLLSMFIIGQALVDSGYLYFL